MSSTPINFTPASSSSSVSNPSKSTTPANPYVQEFETLQSDDAQELFNVSFGSQQNAQLNILSVLSQWAAIDAAEKEAQANTIQTTLAAAGSSSSDATANIPTLEQVQSQSDQQAQTALNNFSSAPSGSSIVDFQA